MKKQNMNTMKQKWINIVANKMCAWELPSTPKAAIGSRRNYTICHNAGGKPVITEKHDWYKINWRQAESKIKNLQEEIVKATLNNDAKEVYRIQRRILQSFEGRALAVRKVITNSGGGKLPE